MTNNGSWIGGLVLIGGVAIIDPQVLIVMLANPNAFVQTAGPALVLATDTDSDIWERAGKADLSGPGMSAEMRTTRSQERERSRSSAEGADPLAQNRRLPELKKQGGPTGSASGDSQSSPDRPSSGGSMGNPSGPS